MYFLWNISDNPILPVFKYSSHSPAKLIKGYRRPVGRQHVQKDRLDPRPFGRRQVVDKGVEQQRTDAVAPVALVHAQRQNITHVIIPPRRLVQYPLVLSIQPRKGLDLRDEQPDDLQVDGGGEGEEARAAGDLLVPGEGVLDGEPVLAEGAHLLQVVGHEEAQLDLRRTGHVDGGRVQQLVAVRGLDLVIVLPGRGGEGL